jgi:hypothetical protein
LLLLRAEAIFWLMDLGAAEEVLPMSGDADLIMEGGRVPADEAIVSGRETTEDPAEAGD